MDASASDPAQLYKVLSGGRPGWAPLVRKMPGAEAPPTEVEIKKAPPPKEEDVFAAIEANRTLVEIGELLAPRQEAVDLVPGALREGGEASPPYCAPYPAFSGYLLGIP